MNYEQFKQQALSLTPGLTEEQIRSAYLDFVDQAGGPDIDLADEAGKALKRGYARQYGQLVGGVQKYLGWDDDIKLGPVTIPGGDTVSQYWGGVAEANAPNPYLQQDIVSHPELLAEPGYWVSGITEQTPQIPMWFAGGLAKTVAGKALGAGGVAGMVETMPDYLQHLEEGMDPAEARMRAAVNVPVIGGLNAMSFGNLLSPWKKPVERVLTTALTEGMTEWAEEPASALVWGEDPLQAAIQGLNVAPIAAVTGGLMGGGTELYNYGKSKQPQNLDLPPVNVPMQYTEEAAELQNPYTFSEPAVAQFSDTGKPVFNFPGWHGSPAKFTEFSDDFIGQGEGAQAYGYGHYIAGAKGVGEFYREALTSSRDGLMVGDTEMQVIPALWFEDIEKAQEAGDKQAFQDQKRALMNHLWKMYRETGSEKYQDDFNAVTEATMGDFHRKKPGALYEVDVKVPEDEFLLWDEKFSNQPPKVQAALREVFGQDMKDDTNYYGENLKGEDFYYQLGGRATGVKYGPGFKEKYGLVGGKGQDALASELLRKLGVQGIKYRDQALRTTGRGDYNYVIFDPQNIQILKTWDQQIQPTPGQAKSFVFASPNEQEDMVFESAQKALASEDQKAFHDFSYRLDEVLFQRGDEKTFSRRHELDAIGDWVDGAENTMVSEFDIAPDYETLKFTAAMKGMFGRQKATIPFMQTDEGTDAVHDFTLNMPVSDARAILSTYGIQFRTLIPSTKKSTRVLVFDQGLELAETLEKLHEETGTDINTYIGQGEFLGSWESRAEGLRTYQEVARGWLQRSEGSPQFKTRLYSLINEAANRAETSNPLSQNNTQFDSTGVRGQVSGASVTNRDVAEAFDTQASAQGRFIHPKDYTESASETIANDMVTEIQYELNSTDTNSAIGWYGPAYQNALTEISTNEGWGDIAKGRKHHGLFTALVAINSDGQTVDNNLSLAVKSYREYLRSGRLRPLSTNRPAGLENNFIILNALIEKYGVERTEALLSQERTIKEWREDGLLPDVDIGAGYLEDMNMPGAIIFGPKIGAFYANLAGNQEYLTMDRWWSRSFNRLRGRLATQPTKSSIETFTKAYEEAVGPIQSEEHMYAEAERLANEYMEQNRYQRDRNPLGRVANTLHKNAVGTQDIPLNGSDRECMIRTARKVQEKLVEQGHNFPLADVQALLWFYEKRLFSDMGTGAKLGDTNYEQAAKQIYSTQAFNAEATGRYAEGVRDTGLRQEGPGLDQQWQTEAETQTPEGDPLADLELETLTAANTVPAGSQIPVGVKYYPVDLVLEQANAVKSRMNELYELGYSAPVPLAEDFAMDVAGILGDIQELGVPGRMIDELTGMYMFGDENGALATYIPDYFGNGPMLGINQKTLELLHNPHSRAADEGMRMALAHEIGHHMDISMSPDHQQSVTWQDPNFSINPVKLGMKVSPDEQSAKIEMSAGPVMSEVISYFNEAEIGPNTLGGMLGYPISDITKIAAKGRILQVGEEEIEIGPDIPENLQAFIKQGLQREVQRIQGEVFAQLYALKKVHPELMKDVLPKSYTFIEHYEEVANEGRTVSDARQRIREDFWSGANQPGTADNAATGRDTTTRSFAEESRIWRTNTGVPGGQTPEGSQWEGQQNDATNEFERIGNLSPTGVVGESLTVEEYELAKQLSKMFKGERQRLGRGKISLPELDQMAAALGMTPEDLAKRAIGSAWNGEQVRAGAELVKSRSNQTMELAKKAMETGSVTDKDAFYESFMSLAEVLIPFQAVATEAGRALRAFRGAKAGANLLEWEQAMNNPRMPINELLEMVSKFDHPSQLPGLAKHILDPTKWDMLIEAWINSLLSGPQTHVVNMTSNTLVDMLSVFEHGVASAISSLRGDQAIPAGAVLARAQGMLRGGITGLRKAKDVFVTEQEFGESKMDQRYQKAIPGKLGQVIRMPGRSLSAEDAYFKTIAYQGALAEYYYTDGKRQGKKGKELRQYIHEGLKNPSELAYKRAMEEAGYYTFTNQLGDLGRSIQKIAHDHPLVRFVIPFIRTPSNIVKYALQRNIVTGPMFKEVKDAWRNRKSDPRAFDMMAARIVTGTSIMMGVAAMALQGAITGAGPSDPQERKLKFQTGWMPYSIRHGDKYYSFSRLEPMGMLFGIAADIAEMSQSDSVSQGELDEIIAMSIMGLTKNLTSKTYLRGISDLFNVMTDPDRYGERWVNSFVGTTIPTLSAQIARTMDPTMRQSRSALDAIMARLPGYREQLAPVLDRYGKPIVREGGLGPDFISPVYMSTYRDDPVANELERLNYKGGYASYSLKNRKLSIEERNFYQAEMGKRAEAALSKLVSTKMYQAADDTKKRDMIDKVYRDVRKVVRPIVYKYMLENFKAEQAQAN